MGKIFIKPVQFDDLVATIGGENLEKARTREESFFATHSFVGVSDTDTVRFAIEVKPKESIYLHFAELYVNSITNDSAYSLTSFSGEIDAITGGSSPDTEVNEITGDAISRVTVDPTAVVPFNVPFSQQIVKDIQITQGASTFIDLSVVINDFRDLSKQPILLKNSNEVGSKYIILQADVVDLLDLAASNAINVQVGIFYSIVNKQD